MDDTDKNIMHLIWADPRIPTQEIAKRLGISRQAVSSRIRVLTEIGVFRSMRATISMYYLDAAIVLIWGKSVADSIGKTLDRLGESELTGHARVAGGNELYVMGVLRNESELNGYVDFVRRTAEIPEPTVGIAYFGDRINPDWVDEGRPRQSCRELSPIDLRIVATLQDNSRKPIAEIAESIGASARTIRRHLNRMKSEGWLWFDRPFDLTSGEELWTVMQVKLRNGADRTKVGSRLLSKHPLRVILMRSFVNIPDFLLGYLYSDKMSEMRKILGEIGDDKDVLKVTPNLLYLERMYCTWASRLPAALTRPSKKAGRLDYQLKMR